MLITELAHFSLFLALVISAMQVILPTYGIVKQQNTPQQLAKALAMAQFVVLLFSFFGLMAGFYNNDFSLVYVAQHSNVFLPWYYKLSATWGGHEGSLLLWITILAGWGAMVAYHSKNLQLAMRVRVLVVLASVQFMMLSMLIVTSSPFNRSVENGVNNQPFINLPIDGASLNPLLQDVGLIVHPPMLYMGYVGMAVPFAFFVAALWSGRLDAVWVRWARPWVLMAWAFLTLGIALGSWWAYYELGWGGWWFWDPVENASLMPWLVCTALIHSLTVTQKRGVFKAWSIMLAICAFALSLLGTFLVRSGVVGSVHAFATDPTRGLFILLILAVVIGTGLLLFAVRGWRLTVESTYQIKSKETLLVINNIILLVATLVVLLGTLYPIIADSMGLGQVSVGPPYFNTFFVPLTWLLLLSMGMGAVIRWKHDKRPLLGISIVIAISSFLLGVILFVLSVLLGTSTHELIPILTQHLVANFSSVITLILGCWVIGWMLYDIKNKMKHTQSVWVGLAKLPLGYWGMQLAHLGVLVSAIGVALSNSHSIQKDIAMGVGDVVYLQGYEFNLVEVYAISGKNYEGVASKVVVHKHDHQVKNGPNMGNKPNKAVELAPLAILHPQKRYYGFGNMGNFGGTSQMPTTEAGIQANLWRDLYIAMGEPIEGANPISASNIDELTSNLQNSQNIKWAMRIYVKPFVRFIWFGGILMALGGLLAIVSKQTR